MRRLLLLFFFALLLTGCTSGDSDPHPVLPSDQALVLRARLATENRYYFEVRLSEGAIVLCHSGVDIARHPFTQPQVGVPRVLWWRRGASDPWIGEIWPDATLNPPLVVERVRIVPGDESTRPTPDVAGVLPPTLQELTAVPPTFQILFPDSRCIQVELRGEISGKVREVSALSLWWDDFREGLGVRQAHPLRLRLKMDAADGAALYRSFPENPSFLTLP